MSQVNDSQPGHPVVVFRVDLSTIDQYSNLVPDQYQSSPDRGRTETAAQANTRVTYIPGLLAAENRELRHGDQFTLYGAKAHYYRVEVRKGNFPMLKIVSEA